MSVQDTRTTEPSEVKRTVDSLTPGAVVHVQKVYGTLAATTAVASVGSVLGMGLMISPMITGFGALVPLIGLYMTNPQTTPAPVRVGLLGTFAVLSGMSVGPLVAVATAMNPFLVPTALGATGVLFGSMTMVALFTKSNSFLRWGAPLGGMTIALMVCGIGAIFVPPTSVLYPVLHNAMLYGGLALGAVWVGFDTQQMIQDYENGQADPLTSAANLFINFKMIFTRILYIFMDR